MTQQPGLGLLDLGPIEDQVPVGGKWLTVRGISVTDAYALFQRFPELHGWALANGRITDELLKIGPDALGAIIALAAGSPGEQGETIAKSLPIEAQLDIIEAIARLTFRSGFGPFVQRIVALAAAVESENSGKAQDTKSQPGSTHSLDEATPQSSSGS